MMHRAVRSIIPQEVAMFDFLKQKDRTPPVFAGRHGAAALFHLRQVQGVGLPLPARYAGPGAGADRLGGKRGRRQRDAGGAGRPGQVPELFAMIQRSDYVRITDIRQKDLPPDPWERGFSVRGY